MTVFPIYRKYTNKETYFKILSENEFEEIQFIGNNAMTHHIQAKQFPEKLRIQDMIECKDNIWTSITVEEYESKNNSSK